MLILRHWATIHLWKSFCRFCHFTFCNKYLAKPFMLQTHLISSHSIFFAHCIQDCTWLVFHSLVHHEFIFCMHCISFSVHYLLFYWTMFVHLFRHEKAKGICHITSINGYFYLFIISISFCIASLLVSLKHF